MTNDKETHATEPANSSQRNPWDPIGMLGHIPEINGAEADPCPGFVPTRHELRLLAEHWYRVILTNDRAYALTQQTGSTEIRETAYAEHRLEQLKNACDLDMYVIASNVGNKLEPIHFSATCILRHHLKRLALRFKHNRKARKMSRGLAPRAIEYHPRFEDILFDYVADSGRASREVCEDIEQGVRTRHGEAIIEHPADRGAAFGEDVYSLVLDAFGVYFTYKPNTIEIRGLSWPLDREPLDDADGGGIICN